ncbi:PH domain-containing protein [Thalassobacillus pellis]|uniref:PH domain-containing protein n=1 Tax=Thalassobacillus pellis TaxID=748008 RepID=UPI00195FE96D|nr:PH domain-containing protein [Thalassobacillus pellis]MBM7554442.1 Cdc6-like AAA superfamily ATPase [Thalassobacillus pellis]
MGVYRTFCYKVEDVFVGLFSKKQDPEEVKQKVKEYRDQKEAIKQKKKEAAQKQAEEAKRQKELKKEQEHQEVLALLSKVLDLNNTNYTEYEYREVKTNKHFFQQLVQTIYEPEEQGLTFLHCEFDKTRNKEIKGYLIATNKRVWFVSKSLQFQQKFRYQTIKDLRYHRDGILEKELKIQYGTKKLEFDEIYEPKQLQKLVNIIERNSLNVHC